MSAYISWVTLAVAPERQDEFAAAMAVEAPVTRGFEGCERFEVFIDRAAGAAYFLEHWRSAEDEARYSAWRAARGDFERLGALLSGAPTSVRLQELARV